MDVPQNADYINQVLASFNRQRFMKYIKAEIRDVKPGYCELFLPFNDNLTQQHGFFHAGVVSTIADNAAGYAAYSLMKSTSSILTVEFKLNLLSPAEGEFIVGCADVIRYGKTLTICRSDVFVSKGGELKLCAISQSTLMELRDRSDK